MTVDNAVETLTTHVSVRQSTLDLIGDSRLRNWLRHSGKRCRLGWNFCRLGWSYHRL
jgi:hypothetical protein